MQYATEPKCNYCDACMNEYCGCKLGRIKEIEPTCDSTAVIPSITVDSVEGITNLANCLVHVTSTNTTYYVDDKHRVMITWAGPVDIPGYDMQNNPNGYRDQIVTDIEKGIAVIYDKHGNGFTFGIFQSLDADGAVTDAVNAKLDEMAENGTLGEIIATYLDNITLVYDNIAELRAADNLRPGDIARTLGYYTPNDGGGSSFRIRAKENSDSDDSATIIIVDDNTAELLIDTSISYDQFGAKGDGATDDYSAIRAAHIFANDHNLTVTANQLKTYYVKNITSAIPVTTNIDWKGAHFIIDDSGTPTDYHLFDVTPTGGTSDFTGVVSSLEKNQMQCDLKGYGNLIVKFVNSNKKDFIRTGGNANQGSSRTEYVRVDNDGRILDPVYFPFEQVTSISARKLDETFLTIENGIFKTIVNTVDSYHYYGRGIIVHRCNVTIKNLTHTVEGEDDTTTSSPYSGFICSVMCANLTVKDCNLSAHKRFYTADNVAKGSYDLNTEGTIDLLVENVHQMNELCNNELWSIHGANYCRNCTFKDSTLSKIDAHKGVYNLYVYNCVVGSRGIGGCGAGEVIIKNTEVNSYRFFYLRDDFGSWFDGKIEIYNCRLNCNEQRVKYLLWALNNDGTHDYGYMCKLPSLKVENFFFNNQSGATERNVIYGFTPATNVDFLASYTTNAANECYPQVFDGSIDIKNVHTNTVSMSVSQMPLCNAEIENLYVEKTGSAPNRAESLHPQSKYNQNIPNMYIKIEDCDITQPNYEFTRPEDDAREWYSATHCSLWTPYLYANLDETFINTHRPVMDITIKKCVNLFLGVSGRAITFHLENCEIRQLRGEVANTPVHMMYCYAKGCKFTVRQIDVEDPSAQNDPGWIFPHIYTYHFEDCYFDVQTWAVNQGNVLEKEAFLYTWRTHNRVLVNVVTSINPSFNYSITDIATQLSVTNMTKEYGVQAQELLSGLSGVAVIRRSGSTSTLPSGTNGVIDNNYGSYIIPTGYKFYDTTTSTDKTFNGTTWV